MPSFTDTFDRADGPLGSDWSTHNGVLSISGNKATGTGTSTAYLAARTIAGDQYATVTLSKSGGAMDHSSPVVKLDHAGDSYYYGWIESGILWQYHIMYHHSGINSQIAANTFADPGLNTVDLKLQYVSGVLSLYLGAALLGSVNHNTLAANSGIGIRIGDGGGYIDSFTCTDGLPDQTLEITPDPLWVGGGPCLVTATGTGTAWTDGGSPSTTFSADHGEVEVYRWVSATEWELVYTPAEYIGTITFSETQYGLSDQVNGVLTPPEEGSNGLCQLTPAGALVVNRAGLQTPDGAVLTTDTVLGDSLPGNPDLTILDGIGDLLTGFYIYHIPGMTYTLGEAIDKLWLAVNGSVDLTGAEIGDQTNDSLNSMLTALRLLFYDDETFTDITLKQLLTAIEAVSTPDLTPVRNDIGINGQETWASLLSVLLAMWGEGGNTLESLAYNLGVIQSAHNYTLESVMDAIAAIPAADLQAVLDKLDLIQPDEDDDLSTIASDIASVNTIVSGIATSLGNYRTGSNYTVQDILDRLDDLEAKIDAIETGGAPVWPGLANVSMGAPVALVDQLVLNGPMDGVIVAVTTPPVGLGQYRVGGRRLDYGQMRLAFETDNGELEGWQYFGFEEAVYTPHSMAQAAKCRFQLLGGLGGTVTPWTRS